MYGKVFDTIYDGTLYGHWEAIVTMQQLIVLCTPDGIVDMTPQAIAARTSIPLEIITKGLKVLSEPDPYTRTPGDEGRRIILMDDHRPWGWVLVNHSKYQHMQDVDTVRAQTRERVRKHRESKRTVTDGNAEKRHSDSDSDSDKKPIVGQKPDVAPPEIRNGHNLATARGVLAFLNEKTGRRYQPVKANLALIAARLRDGATETELRQVVAKKCREWLSDEKMAQFLRPATLFRASNFAQYQGELEHADD